MTTFEQVNTLAPQPDIIPIVESSLFAGHPEARYAVGKLAIGSTVVPGMKEEYLGYLKLRANVYAGQTGMLSESRVNGDGTETDEDDKRSVHFGIVENEGDRQRIVAAMRLIVKETDESDVLPVEKFFPEIFRESAKGKSIEVSRYISRHENSNIQAELSWPLYSVALSHTMSNELGPTYAVIEPGLERRLRTFAVPLRALAEPKFLAAYNDFNLPAEFDTTRLARIVRARNPLAYTAMLGSQDQFTYFDIDDDKLVSLPEQAA